jgi:Pyruvate/2-oxoacid:ferredoxin oxidoreductase delta subunit
MKRPIVHIDEDRCDGCGLCVPACAEGAIQIVDGKARLVSETYCDGLGACLGECPNDAIRIVEREAEAFDEVAVSHQVGPAAGRPDDRGRAASAPNPVSHGCPGSAVRTLGPRADEAPARGPVPAGGPSMLATWPVQLALVPVKAPFFDGSRLLVAADCVPFALRDFHEQLLDGRVLVIGCPKLDDLELYWRKLAAIFSQNDVRSVEVAHMEVPCCTGIVRAVEKAVEAAGKDIPVRTVRIGIRGDVEEVRDSGVGGAPGPCGCSEAEP